MQIKIPRIYVPDFWLANFGKVQDYLADRVAKGHVHEVGRSTQDRPIHAIEYNPQASTGLMVIAGTHGHEPGGVASAMNLIHLLETGADLDGQPHERLLELLASVRVYVTPVLNPDGRVVNMDSYYAQGIDTVTVYASGLTKEGKIIPYDAGSDEPLYYFDPQGAIFMGGQFNAAGYAINRRRSPDQSDAVEVQAVFDFVKDRGLDAIIDLHACGYNFAFQARSHEAPYWPVMREWQRRAQKLFAEKGRKLGKLHGDGDPPEPPKFYFNSTLFHRHARLMWVAYEGRQGYVGSPSFMPLPTEWEIIDDYLSAVTVFVELGVEGYYARANREAFG